MKEQFSSGRRKFFSLLAGAAAAIPFAATLKGHCAGAPAPKQTLVITASGSVGIGVNGPSGTFDVISTSSGLPKIIHLDH